MFIIQSITISYGISYLERLMNLNNVDWICYNFRLNPIFKKLMNIDMQLNPKLNMVDIIIDVIKEQTWHVVEGHNIFSDVMCKELNIYFGK